MATQNPIENEGTYALPEAQLDRFLFKLVMDYPGEADEQKILALHLAGSSPERILADQVVPATEAGGVLLLQALAQRLTVDQSIVTYITSIVRRTRGYPGLFMGASPRAGIAMLAASRAAALAAGRAFVTPDDVAEVALPALRHRVILSPEAEVEGKKVDGILGELLKSVEVPRGTAG
jgi:MoxR-like ATPase